MHGFRVPTDPHRIIIHHASLSTKNQTSEYELRPLLRHIADKPAFSQVQLFAPSIAPDQPLEALAASLANHNVPCYYKIQGSLASLLATSFLHPHQENGDIFLNSLGSIDNFNAFTLLPNGLCVLRLDSATYEQLGLVGRCLHGIGEAKQWEVRFDTKEKHYQPDGNLYKRIQACLSPPHIQPVDAICIYIPRNDKIKPNKEFPLSFPQSILHERLNVNHSMYKYQSLRLPDLSFLLESKHIDDEIAMQLHEWFGCISLRLDSLLSTLDNLDTSTHAMPMFDQLNLDPVSESPSVSFQWNGVLSSPHAQSLLHRALDLIEKRKIPWAILGLWGIRDTCMVSQTNSQVISTDGNGDHHSVIVLLPHGKYIIYTDHHAT